VRRDLAGDERLSRLEGARPVDERRRRESQGVRDVGAVARGCHAHEHEVVALGDHELVDALRALRRHEEVEPELPPLCCDSGRMLACQRRHLVCGLARADVVRLVDDDQHRVAVRATAPESGKDALRGDRSFPGGAERAEVGN
jgi:hypothetical protein